MGSVIWTNLAEPQTQAIKRATGMRHGEIPEALKGPDDYINIQGLWPSRYQKYLGFARLVRELRRRTVSGEDKDGVLVDRTCVCVCIERLGEVGIGE